MRLTHRFLHRLCPLAAGGALALSSSDGFAQVAAENVAAARSLGIQGVQLADAGKCPEAIEKLERAEELYHAPTILGRLGECQVEVGQIVLGTENLNRVVREQLEPNAPRAFRAAQERAAKVLQEALPRIARLTVVVEPRDVQARVTVSGAEVPSALIGAERPTDPGSHEIVATAQGYLEARTSVDLPEGARQVVSLKLAPDPVALAPEPTPEPPPPETPPPSQPVSQSSGTKTIGFALIGLGGVGIVAGGITGMMALQKKGDLDCPNKECVGEEADKLDSANTLATVSTIGFGVGVPALTVGVILLLTSGKSDEGPTTGRDSFSASPYVGLNTAGISGTF